MQQLHERFLTPISPKPAHDESRIVTPCILEEGHSELFCTWRQEGKCHCHTDEETVVAKPFDVQITIFCSALPSR